MTFDSDFALLLGGHMTFLKSQLLDLHIFHMWYEMSFKAEEWIFVGDLDIDAHSKKQVQVCKDHGLKIKGAILCNDDEHKNSEACRKVPAFPSFCNTKTNVCVAGLRESKEHFDALQKISDDEMHRRSH